MTLSELVQVAQQQRQQLRWPSRMAPPSSSRRRRSGCRRRHSRSGDSSSGRESVGDVAVHCVELVVVSSDLCSGTIAQHATRALESCANIDHERGERNITESLAAEQNITESLATRSQIMKSHRTPLPPCLTPFTNTKVLSLPIKFSQIQPCDAQRMRTVMSPLKCPVACAVQMLVPPNNIAADCRMQSQDKMLQLAAGCNQAAAAPSI